MDRLRAKIESILFICGEPISEKRLGKVLKADQEDIQQALRKLQADCAARGVRLLEKSGEWQFVTAPESSDIVETLIKAEYSENLSRAALEVLSIVAYKGPLTRAEVEFIRGVNSVYSLRNLLMRGLIEKRENEKDGRSHLYSVTFDFLRHFGLADAKELPQYEEFHKAEVPKEEDITGETRENHVS